MTRLKPRHERFCHSFVECTNASVAARAAGYAPQSARNAGYRLLRHPRIAARIAEIQRETAQAHCRNVDTLLGKLETIYRRAVDDRHFSAATRAVELQAKLAGVGPATAAPRGRSAAAVVPSAAGDNDAASGVQPLIEAGIPAEPATRRSATVKRPPPPATEES